MVDGDRGDLWGRCTDLLEEDFQVATPVAASELDDRDGLSRTIEFRAALTDRKVGSKP
jgi:hypothetical protein